MNDEGYCLFLLIACMVTLAVPSTGQMLVAVFAFALAVAARIAPVAAHGHHQHHTRRDAAGR